MNWFVTFDKLFSEVLSLFSLLLTSLYAISCRLMKWWIFIFLLVKEAWNVSFDTSVMIPHNNSFTLLIILFFLAAWSWTYLFCLCRHDSLLNTFERFSHNSVFKTFLFLHHGVLNPLMLGRWLKILALSFSSILFHLCPAGFAWVTLANFGMPAHTSSF